MQSSALLGSAALAGVLGIALLIRSRRVGPSNAADTPKSGNPADEIVLIGFPRVPDVVVSCSPFVAKVEAWLRMMGLPYTLKYGSTSGTPKGQLPIIIHGPNVVADSTFIIKYLQRTYPATGKKLSDEEAAICTVVHHFMEKYILFGMFYFRWIQPMSWEWAKNGLMSFAPRPLRALLLRWAIRPHMQALMYYQGMWRHSEADVLELMREGLTALSVLLGDQDFFTGSKPCAADAAAFAFLDNVLHDHIWAKPDLREMVEGYTNLVEYTDRIRSTYFAHELAWEETSES